VAALAPRPPQESTLHRRPASTPSGTAPSKRPQASNRWFNRLLGCRPDKDSYPIGAWQSFVKQYRIAETRVFNDPDSN